MKIFMFYIICIFNWAYVYSDAGFNQTYHMLVTNKNATEFEVKLNATNRNETYSVHRFKVTIQAMNKTNSNSSILQTTENPIFSDVKNLTTLEPKQTSDRNKTNVKCKRNTVKPDPSNCSRYIICVNGVRLTMLCAYGTLWEEASGKCLHADEVNCKNRKNPFHHFQNKDGQTNFRCPKLNGLFANPKTCRKFYQCVWGKPVIKYCPKSTTWDAKLKICNKRKTKCN